MENETRSQVSPSSVDPACPPGSEFHSLLTFFPRKHHKLLQTLQSSRRLFRFVYSSVKSIMLFLKIEEMQAEATTGPGGPWSAERWWSLPLACPPPAPRLCELRYEF